MVRSTAKRSDGDDESVGCDSDVVAAVVVVVVVDDADTSVTDTDIEDVEDSASMPPSVELQAPKMSAKPQTSDTPNRISHLPVPHHHYRASAYPLLETCTRNPPITAHMGGLKACSSCGTIDVCR